MTTIKRHGGWKSSAVAEGYLEDFMAGKNRITSHILPSDSVKTSNNGRGNSVEEKERMMSEISPSSSDGSLLPNVLSSVDSAGSSFLNISCNAWNKVSDNKMLRTRSHNFSINNCSNFIVHVNAGKI